MGSGSKASGGLIQTMPATTTKVHNAHVFLRFSCLYCLYACVCVSHSYGSNRYTLNVIEFHHGAGVDSHLLLLLLLLLQYCMCPATAVAPALHMQFRFNLSSTHAVAIRNAQHVACFVVVAAAAVVISKTTTITTVCMYVVVVLCVCI